MQVGYVLLQIILLGQGGTRNPKVCCTALEAINISTIKKIQQNYVLWKYNLRNQIILYQQAINLRS
jgi:hypothetical protein